MKAVFYSANVVTLGSAPPRAEAIAVEDGRIIALGSDGDLSSQRHGALLVDCHGGALLPGFIDAHIHLLSYAASLTSVDCSPDAVSSIADIQEALRRKAAQTPAGHWVRATGYDEAALAERRHPTRQDLDAAVPANPVRLIHRSGHASVLNTPALSAMGIGAAVDSTGLLIEMNDLLDAVIPRIDDVELTQAVRRAGDNLFREGVTAIQDATPNGPDEWETFRRLLSGNNLRLPVTLFEGFDALGKLPEQALDGRLRRGPVKIVIDESEGQIVPDEARLAEMVWQAHGHGRQVAIHAVEQPAIEAAVNAIAASLRQAPRTEHRHRVEHCGICPKKLADRIAGLGIVVVSQPPFLYHNGDRYLKTVPPADLPHLYPFGDLLRSRVRLAAGSDAPVVPPRPLLSVQSAITRCGRLGASLSHEQSLTIDQALRMHTIDAAWSAFDEHERGSIEIGKRADFVLLSGDPTAVPPDEIADLEIEMTIIAGEIAWPA